MSDEYTPTTEEVLGMLGSHLYEYGAECDMNLPGNDPDEIVGRWLAKRDAEVAAKALNDLAEELLDEADPDSYTRIYDKWDVASFLDTEATRIKALEGDE